jgi:hypothetical protein
MPDKRGEARRDHRSAMETAVLLGDIAAGA